MSSYEAEGNAKVTSYQGDVKPLFSQSQRDCMTFKFDLYSYDDTKTWCGKIIKRLKDGDMPADGTAPWPAERIAIIEAWRDQGFPP